MADPAPYPRQNPPIEHDKLFDHEYDGIREYDNPMPGWWVWMFVLCVVFAAPYLMHYQWGQGPTIHDRLDAELAAYAAKLMETYGDLQPDAPTILSFMDDEVAMAGMAGLFKGKCAQCHLADGSGNVGPNLTDDRYINIRTLTDIPTLISEGSIAKGMPAWEGSLTTTEIVLLSAYIAQLRGRDLPGKAPQGDAIPPWPDPPPPAAAPVEPAGGASATPPG